MKKNVRSVDIHDSDRQLACCLERIRHLKIRLGNKQNIFDFGRALSVIEGLSPGRRLAILQSLIYASKHIKKNFEACTKEDIKQYVEHLEQDDLSPWTVYQRKIMIRKFFRWLALGDEYLDKEKPMPETVRWMRCTMSRKAKQECRVQPSAILTIEEVKRLIDCCESPRDKAFVSLLYEMGARIGEIGGLKIKDVHRSRYGFEIDLSGKTGRRTPLVIDSEAYVSAWLNCHPLKDDPEAWLWVGVNKRKWMRNKPRKWAGLAQTVRVRDAGAYQRMQYAGLTRLVKMAVLRAGITKRIYNHLFRHSRVTHLKRSRALDDAQADLFFGWTPGGNMSSEYTHLTDKDANTAILRMHGKEDEQPEKSSLEPKFCLFCQAANPSNAFFCHRCNQNIDVNPVARQMDTMQQQILSLAQSLAATRGINQQMMTQQQEFALGDNRLFVTGSSTYLTDAKGAMTQHWVLCPACGKHFDNTHPHYCEKSPVGQNSEANPENWPRGVGQNKNPEFKKLI